MSRACSGLCRSPVSLALTTALALTMVAGCAGREAAGRPANPDPLEPMNRVIYRINDVGDRYLARPVAKAYEKATPRVARVGATHFFDNLRYPITIVNDFLQGKFRQGSSDLARFLLNSTAGLLGVFDPATDVGLPLHDEDFGQTLALWGVPQGPYLMVPVFGPYTVSSAFGDLLDTQVSPLVQYPDSSVRSKLGVWYLVHARYQLLSVDEEVRRAFDPYIFVRDAYLQRRMFKIYDGNVPEEEPLPEDDRDEG